MVLASNTYTVGKKTFIDEDVLTGYHLDTHAFEWMQQYEAYWLGAGVFSEAYHVRPGIVKILTTSRFKGAWLEHLGLLLNQEIIGAAYSYLSRSVTPVYVLTVPMMERLAEYEYDWADSITMPLSFQHPLVRPAWEFVVANYADFTYRGLNVWRYDVHHGNILRLGADTYLTDPFVEPMHVEVHAFKDALVSIEVIKMRLDNATKIV